MNKNKIVIIDNDTGNQASVFNAIKNLGYNVKISRTKSDFDESTHLIFPGVGSFPNFINNFNKLNIKDILFENILNKKKPILGICVGMQVLSTIGNEFEKIQGLDLIAGEVKKINNDKLLLPHIGWNEVKFLKETEITKNFKDNFDFYFVHSYYFDVSDRNSITGVTTYNHEIPCIIEKDNIFGVQFHPEKSQNAGLLLLKIFYLSNEKKD